MVLISLLYMVRAVSENLLQRFQNSRTAIENSRNHRQEPQLYESRLPHSGLADRSFHRYTLKMRYSAPSFTEPLCTT